MKKILLLSLACVITSISTQAQSSVDTPLWDTDITVKKETGEKYAKPVVSIDYKGNIYIGRIVKVGSATKYTKWEVLKSTDKGATFTVFASGTAPTDYFITAFDMITAGNKTANFRVFVSAGYVDSANAARLFAKGYKEDGSAEDLSFHNEGFTAHEYRGITDLSWATDSRSPNTSATEYTISLVAAKAQYSADSVIVYTTNTSLTNFKRVAVFDTFKYISDVSASIGRKKLNDDGRLIIDWNVCTNPNDTFGQCHFVGLNPKTGAIEVPITYDPFTSYSKLKLTLAQDGMNDKFQGIATFYIKDNALSKYYNFIDFFTYEAGLVFESYEQFDTSTVYGRNITNMYDVKEKRFLIAFYNTQTKSIDVRSKPLYGPSGEKSTLLKSKVRNAATVINEPEISIDNFGTDNGLGTVVVWNSNGTIMMDYELKEPVSIHTPQNLQDVSLYPNPTKDHLYIQFDAQTADALQLQIVDVTGKTVFTNTQSIVPGNNQIQVSTVHLENGNYLLQLIGKDGRQTLPFTIVK